MNGCIIQARMGSTRLPGKILKNIDEKNNVLDFLLNQLNYSKKIDEIIIATTKNREDDVIEEFSRKRKIECFRGEENDVLNRYYQTAKKYSVDNIIRITSDNPLIDPEYIDKGLDIFLSKKLDLLSTSESNTFPYGVVFEIISFSAIEKISKKELSNFEKEHVTSFFYSNQDKFKIYSYIFENNVSNIRCSIDTLNDLIFVRELLKKIENRPVIVSDIIEVTSRFPELLDINNKN